MSSAPQFILLVVVGAAAAGINAVAGGGSLISYPVLTLGVKIADLLANATNSVALWPGSAGGAIGYWNLIHKTGRYFRVFIGPTIVGAALGAYLLTITKDADFKRIIPFLILLAAVMLVFQPRIKARALHAGGVPMPVGLLIQFLVAIYGGYFGAGMGIMMLGAFALTMEGDIHELNAVKNWLGLFINFVASILFVIKGLVLYDVALPLTLGSIVGGYSSAKVSQRFDPEKLRIVIATYGIAMALYFFWRGYGA